MLHWKYKIGNKTFKFYVTNFYYANKTGYLTRVVLFNHFHKCKSWTCQKSLSKCLPQLFLLYLIKLWKTWMQLSFLLVSLCINEPTDENIYISQRSSEAPCLLMYNQYLWWFSLSFVFSPHLVPVCLLYNTFHLWIFC